MSMTGHEKKDHPRTLREARASFDPISILIEEHQRIRAMLSAFGHELELFEQGRQPDYEILGGSIDYCREYLDHWHHPREDALLAILARRAPAQAKACGSLENQHIDLAHATGSLVSIFEAVERDAPFLRADLVNRGRALMREYRRHLNWEESEFFPAISKHFSAADFEEAEALFADSSDPLSKNTLDDRYRALFIALERT